MSDIYFFEIEVGALPGSEMRETGAGHGGFVAVFVKAKSKADAESNLRSKLAQDHYELRSIDHTGLHAAFEWDDDVQQEYDELAATAEAVGFAYGEFYSWDEH